MNCRNVIVVGASAGGVEALKLLASKLPADLRAPVLVVLHIPVHTPSMLHNILESAGPLPAKSAEDNEEMKPGVIYVAPTDRHLLIEGQRLRLTRGPRENRVRPCIDVLFRSAALEFGERVIGIILTGALDDGTAGLWAIKDRKGLTIVQDPDEAEWDSMPLSAIRNVAIDYTLAVEAIAGRLPGLLAEQAPESALSQPSDTMKKEVTIAIDGNGLKRGVMSMGTISPNTCPECHGVLVRIKEGRIIRYRCHTGHAFSLQTLLADVDDAIDDSLWNAIRAIEERSLVLREMQEVAQEDCYADLAANCGNLAQQAEERAQRVRDLVIRDRNAK